MKRLTLLGATGSIGRSTLDLVRCHPSDWHLYAVAAARSVDEMVAICREFSPDLAVMTDIAAADQLRQRLADCGCPTQVEGGSEALLPIVTAHEVDTVMAAIVGAAGLLPTMAAVKAGKRVLLANKESLVTSGRLLIDAVASSGAELLPIDSEHNAIFQCLPLAVQQAGGRAHLAAHGIHKILLTGSGGPFRSRPLGELAKVTPDEACRHPNWQMGRKISVDSATMMNKGLEYIEARWLFNTRPHELSVVVHPQSVIHSMVQYCDGSVLAQLGLPDMRTPIAHAMGYPQRIDSGVAPLDFTRVGDLSFGEPDLQRYPCLALAQQACWSGQAACTALNAANEEAVAAFLEGRISYPRIAAVVADVLGLDYGNEPVCLDGVLAVDTMARQAACRLIDRDNHRS
ncbi:MAG: 1-deoxy-D-xylulose-5-phosphate reductoisomerase [Gammaproteobacteria bacterium]|nr:1-deoxy-D-xylulose-5-phosphate reductoisomerase [Gammaproteobacteria bacterium]